MFARLAVPADLDALLQLEASCWEEHLRASRQQIQSRLALRPRHQFVVEEQGRVSGVLYTQRIESTEALVCGRFERQEDLHSPEGSVVQLLAIAVQSREGGNCAAFLRDHALAVAKDEPRVRSVVAMTRCSAYVPREVSVSTEPGRTSSSTSSSTSLYDDYVGGCKDPTIFFHVSGGAEIVKIVHGYRPEDLNNEGCAVLIEYSLYPALLTPNESLRPLDLSLSATLLQDICAHMAVLNPHCLQLASPSTASFLNIMDSFQLQSLHMWLESCLKRSLSPAFLFNYPTPLLVVDFLSGRVASGI